MMAFPFPTSTTRQTLLRYSLYPFLPLRRNYFKRLDSVSLSSKPFLAQLNSNEGNGDSGNGLSIPSDKNSSFIDVRSDSDNVNIWEEIEYVEVFGIGSRKDAALDFCLNSPFVSPALRFWNILPKDSANMQLQERFSRQERTLAYHIPYPRLTVPLKITFYPPLYAPDSQSFFILGTLVQLVSPPASLNVTPRIVEAPSDLKSCSKAVILVASAAYGSDDIAACNILQKIKSASGLVVGIILKPFSFEGPRRRDEVNELVSKLQKHKALCIAVDTDALLEKDLVTLDEALKTSNNAVLMAINAISVVISEQHIKLLEVADNGIKPLNSPELQKILESYKEAKIGFGAGRSIKTSVSRAVHDCPFLGAGVKDSSATVLFILASSGTINNNDADTILPILRLTTGCKRDIILSIIHEPKLDPCLILTTIITFGYTGQQSSQENSLFSRLAQKFPFIFNILKKRSQQPDNKKSYVSEDPRLSEVVFSKDNDEMPVKTSLGCISEVANFYMEEQEPPLRNSDEVLFSLRNFGSKSEQSDIEFLEPNSHPLTYVPNANGVPTFKEELLTRYRLGPDNQNIEDWAEEGDADTEATPAVDSVNIYRLPVGVKHLGHLNNFPADKHQTRWKIEDSRKAQSDATSRISRSAVSDKSSEATVDSNSISMAKRGSHASDSNKQGILSIRAASMLEAERDSQKKWSPVVEMRYRGGMYRGRIQGGLPEGKGRLSLGDGSIYDGMWRYGKRSGLGTFYFNNGDVFQGSWRDDAMHGKGWFYFRTGDRWFVNFWKGKANGEGRFYSKHGDVFFGHFKDGWRHGHFLCIDVDGARCHEVWEGGVLVSREHLDPDADAA